MKSIIGVLLIVIAIYALGAWLSYQFGGAVAIAGGAILCAFLLGIGMTGGNKPKAT